MIWCDKDACECHLPECTAHGCMEASRSITDCGQDGCGECDVCGYLNFLEWCGQVASSVPHVVERNKAIEQHLDLAYPHWRT
jgi:hypothetical protein